MINNVTWGNTALNIWHRCGQVEKYWISVAAIQTYHCCYQPLKLISAPYTSLFLSSLVFPVLLPVPAPFPQSDRHRSVPCLYLLYVLWQNRGKWPWRWRGPWALWLNANKKLWSHRACRDKAGWCRQRESERVWWNHHPQLGGETGSPPTLRPKVGLQSVITWYCLVNGEASALIKTKTSLNKNTM